MKRFNTTLLIALLAVIIGVLLSSLYYGIIYPQKKFDGDYNKWRKLNLILQEVERNYVDTIDMKSMTDAAIQAALTTLDPHSTYLPPVELIESDLELAGNFEGIGIQFNVPNDTAIVLSVIPGGPSEKAGLNKGDRIIKVDDKVIAGTETHQDSMVRLMKGPAGTKVNLVVKRNNTLIPFEIKRGKIPVNSIDAAFMLNDTTAYIKLTKFTRTTYDEFIEAKDKLLSKGMKRLIFDLRDNTGGYFDQSMYLSNEFLPKESMIVYMEGLNRKKEDYKANGKGSLQDIELSVLINEGSASSSEIFAGAIQDNDRGVIVGRRSFGKGLVQEPINFTDGSGIRLTVARFHTPSGRCIQKPYEGKAYAYDFYERYAHGELFDADSIKVDSSAVYYTLKGREVYGGGGIIPDIFVPIDTTKATSYFMQASKKSTILRFSSYIFDKYRTKLVEIDNYPELETYLNSLNLGSQFRTYAKNVDNISPKPGEWEETLPYLIPQLKALVGRYSKLNEEAFYRFYLPVDEAINIALNHPSVVSY